MIIQRLDLQAFGRFTDVSLDLSAAPRRFHLIYGPNESGKTTSLRAITSLLFGMQHRTDDNYLHNNAQLRVGGLLVAADGTELECVRRRGRKATLRDAEDNQPIDEALMGAMLGGIDRETFLTRFGLSHQELVEGGTAIIAGEGDLGQILFAAGAGVSGLREIQSQLVDARDQLFVPRGNRAINQSIKQLTENRKQLRRLQVQPTAFLDLRDRLQRRRDKAATLTQASHRQTIQLERLRAYQQALPLLPQWHADQHELAELFDVTLLDDAFSERRREAESQREVAAKLCQTLTDRMTELTKQLESMPIDSAASEHEAEIESLFQELAARDKADRDRADLMRVRRNLDRKIIDLLEELSSRVTSEDLERSDIIEEVVQKLRVSDARRTRIHELAAQHEKLIQQRDDTADGLKTLERKLNDLNVQLDELGGPIDPAALSAVLDEIGSPASILESLEQQHATCQRIQEQCENYLQSLQGFGGDCKAAARLEIPEAATIEHLTEELARADESVRTSKAQLAAAQQERDQLNRRLIADRQDQPLPRVDDLKKSRQTRDRSVDALSDDSSLENRSHVIQQLREQIATADSIADSIRLHHQRIHQRSVDEAKLKSLDQKIAELERAVETAIHSLNGKQDHWDSTWRGCGVKAESPQRMRRWVSSHEKLVVRVKQWESEEHRRKQLRQRVGRATTRLRAALDSVNASRTVSVGGGYAQAGLFDPPPSADSLDSLYDDAVSLRSELLAKRQDYETLRRRRDECSEEIPAVQTRLEKFQRNVEQWENDWRRLTESFPGQQGATTSVVLSMLSRIDDLCAKKRERDILSSRIASIGEDDQKYTCRVLRLAATLQLDTDRQTESGAIARIMYSRLQTERSSASKRASTISEIEQARQRLAESSGQRDQSEVMLRQLSTEAGVSSADQLPELERRSRQRARVEASLRDLENQLGLLAGDQSIDEFIQAVRQQQPALLSDQIQETQTELDNTRQQLSETQQEIGALQHEMELMNGSGRAAELNQENQFLIGRLDRDAQHYARLKIASVIMQRAIDHYRRENQNPVLAYAQEMFERLTCGEYRSLKVDYDARGRSILFGERNGLNDSPSLDIPVSLMSAGTADALYLALRLASLKHQLRHGQPIPLVIDDCLIQLDDDRAIAAVKLLSQLSESTQVILFTHHQHLLDLAEQHLEAGGFHVHCL